MADGTELDSLNSVKYLYLRKLTEPRDNSLRVVVRLMWKSYVAYLVTEEVVGSCRHEDEIYTGNLFRVYTKSHFLEYMARNTGGHMNPVLHFQLLCLNHLIDVAAYETPQFQGIEPESSIRNLFNRKHGR